MFAEIMIVLKRIKPGDFPLIYKLLIALCEWRQANKEPLKDEGLYLDSKAQKLTEIFDLIDETVFNRSGKHVFDIAGEIKKLVKED